MCIVCASSHWHVLAVGVGHDGFEHPAVQEWGMSTGGEPTQSKPTPRSLRLFGFNILAGLVVHKFEEQDGGSHGIIFPGDGVPC